MNKLKVTLAGLLIACFGIGVVNAQDKPSAAPAKQTPAKKSTKKSATPKAATDAKTTKPAADKSAAKPAGQHLKKDGSPDMRYKENKAAKPATTTPASKTGTTTPKKTGTKKPAAKKAATDNKPM
ncbi:MAG TPA: hypothetical protein VK808_07245 [Bacteroidia bacterium]|jgi:hypothetical protein|nr:hypothetical protein [Bacteroidia bacterium]